MNPRFLKLVLFVSAILGLSWLIKEIAELGIFQESPQARAHSELELSMDELRARQHIGP